MRKACCPIKYQYFFIINIPHSLIVQSKGYAFASGVHGIFSKYHAVGAFLRFLGFPPERGGLPSMNACEHLRWQRQMSVHIITTDKILQLVMPSGYGIAKKQIVSETRRCTSFSEFMLPGNFCKIAHMWWQTCKCQKY